MANENPILNNPYEEPEGHYATNLAGELDYSKPVKGRRVFTPEIQTIPVRQGAQEELMELSEVAEAQYGGHAVNLLRREVSSWRNDKYPQTTRITRELLHFWFLNPERDMTQSLFFAQREAIETAVWLNEVAEKSNVGQHILRELEKAQAVSGSAENNLPRVAFKMATGTGKTVVMAALIAYHYFNRAEYRNDVRFADNFLIVAPGITIRDRLGVLRVDTRGGIEAEEDYSQVLGRLLAGFRAGSRVLVINDEAHHCYLPKEDERKAEGEDSEKENERAAVWFNGLVRVAQRYKVRSVYDLSATPYFLTGSGYDPYTLFPWTVSDFGLIEAIESGLVKIPFLPTRDDTQELELPVLRNLYEHVREGLPKAGRKKQKARAREEGKTLVEEPPRLPEMLKTALAQFYEHYEEEFRSRKHSAAATGTAQLALEDTPPVFIVVCNNTSVSKEVYKYLAGYEIPAEEGSGDGPHAVPGVFELFSNYDPGTRQARVKPPTLLIDSDALENSEQIDDEFRRVFAPEILRFKGDYARVYGQGAAERIEDAEILREVVNTVGKRNALGSHIRCVVSVSMLTEGWDANTVTHICGIRRFGSQLLCEQVAGRALRRRSYYLQGYDRQGQPTSDKRRIATWKFPPEYAHVIGVPFKLFKGGKTDARPPQPATRVFALPERTEKYEITFPNVEGYRLEYAQGPLRADFSGIDDYAIDGSKLPTQTFMGTAVSGEEVELSPEGILGMREQQIVYHIARGLVQSHFSDEKGQPEFHRFHELREIVAWWYREKLKVLGKDQQWKKLVYYADPKKVVAHIRRGVKTAGTAEERIRAILNHYNPTGSSRYVHGQTSRDAYPTRHSHVNVVVVDSGWEGKAAKTLDDLTDEGHTLAWVKNAFLDFRIPYTDQAGEQRDYYPDFIVRCRLAGGGLINLLVEVTGFNQDKEEKRWTVLNRWLPAVNSMAPRRGWLTWDFLELDQERAVADFRNLLLARLKAIALAEPLTGTWAARRDYELASGLIDEDFDEPPRTVDRREFPELFE